MVTRNQVIGLVLLFVAIIVVLFYPIWIGTLLNEKFGAAFIIKPIDDLDADYLTMTEWWISNFARSAYVFPYDKLHYHVTVTSKVPYPTIAKYTLKLNSGNSSSLIADEKILLDPNDFKQISHEFSTNHEGYHNVELTLSLYNGTADFNSVGTLLEKEPKSTKLDVLSLNDKLLSEQNWYIFVGLVVSSMIGVITAYAVWKERKTAQEQIRELKIQNQHLKTQNDNFKEQSEKEYKLIKEEQKRNILFRIFELLSSMEQRKLREEIFHEHCKYHLFGKKIDGEAKFIPENELKQKADRVIAPFDQIGIIIENGLLDEKLFLEVYGGMVTRTWIALEDYIQNNTLEFARNFRELNDKAMNHFLSKNLEIPHPHCDNFEHHELLSHKKYVDPENKK